MNHQETMTDYLMAFIEGLKNSGVEQAVISPVVPFHTTGFITSSGNRNPNFCRCR